MSSKNTSPVKLGSLPPCIGTPRVSEPQAPLWAFERCDVPARLLPSQQRRRALAEALRRNRHDSLRTAGSACDWCALAESLAQPERGGSRSSVHFSARLLLAMLTQQSAASRATRDGRGWQHWWLVIAGGGTVSQSGAAQSSRLVALLCPAAAGKGHAAVGCDATIAIGCAADSAGVWCWLAAALGGSVG